MTVPKKKQKKGKSLRTRKQSVSSQSVEGPEDVRRSSRETMQSSTAAVARKPRKVQALPYIPPGTVITTTIGELIQGIRQIPEQHQARFGITPEGGSGAKILMAGGASLVMGPGGSIVW